MIRTALGLGGVQRQTVAHRHERVLQQRAHGCVRVHVSGRDSGYAQAPGEPLQLPVAPPITARICSLKLDPQRVRAERVEQSPGGRLLGDPVLGAAREADQPLSVLEHPSPTGRSAGPRAGRASRVYGRARG